MKLHSPSFEKGLRARLKKVIGGNPELRRQWKRAPRRTRARMGFGILVRVLVSVGLGWAVLAAGTADWPRSAQSAIGALWFLSSALLLRFHILNAFYRLDYLGAFTVFPAPRELVWRWNHEKSVKFAGRTALDAFAMLIAMALTHKATLIGWVMMIPAAALLVILVQAMAMWLVFLPIPSIVNLLPALGGIAFGVLASAKGLREWLLRLLIEQSEWLSTALPAGWVLRSYLAFLAGTRLEVLTLLIPAIGLAASLIWAQRRFASTYAPFDFALWHAFHVPPPQFKEDFNRLLAERPAPPGPTETTDAMKSREFFAPAFAVEAGGWIEQQVLAWLTPREQALIELAYFHLPRWSRMALVGLGMFAVAIACAALAKRAADGSVESAATWTAVVSAVVGGLLALPLSTGFKRLFQPVDAGGILLPFGAVFPATLMEFVRLALKISLVRGAFILPFLCAGGGLLGIALQISVLDATLGALKIVLLSVAFTPMLLVANQSGASNDTSKASFRAFRLIVFFVVAFLGFIGLSAASLFAPFSWAMGCILLAMGISAGLARFYATVDARRQFDLMRPPN
ncbi:MAG: hypothetical protein L0Z50_39855 [Verrucomicrobiales bacterium]|nr:hypothetical protein [Verrucomicrobiales bacterium]